MKKLLFTTILLLLASPCWAWNWPVITAMQSGGATSCIDPGTTDIAQEDGSNTSNRTSGAYVQEIIATETGTIYSVSIYAQFISYADNVEVRLANTKDLSTTYASEVVNVSAQGWVEFVFDGALSVTNTQAFYLAFLSQDLGGVGMGVDTSGNGYYTSGGYALLSGGVWDASSATFNSDNSAKFRVKYCD